VLTEDAFETQDKHQCILAEHSWSDHRKHIL